MIAWDARQAGRALAFASLFAVIAWLVTATSDEGGIAFGVRVARTLPAAPLCAALGTWIVHARARRRGELLALETLGVGPRRSGAAAVAGGAALAVVFALGIGASPRFAVGVFFPAVPPASEVAFNRAGFVDLRRGVRVEADGSLTRLPTAAPSPPSGAPPGARAVAALTVACTGVALTLLAASRGGRVAAASAVLVASAAVLIGFHAAAAGAIAAPVAAAPSAILLAWSLRRYGRSPRGGG